LANWNIRTALADGLAEILPDDWNLYPGYVAPDTLDATTVWFSLTSIERHPKNPSGTRLATMTITLATPITGIDEREDSIDQDLITFLEALEGIENLVWTDAKRGNTGAGNLGYDITITIPYSAQTTN
jgi:hypothetical protein